LPSTPGSAGGLDPVAVALAVEPAVLVPVPAAEAAVAFAAWSLLASRPT